MAVKRTHRRLLILTLVIASIGVAVAAALAVAADAPSDRPTGDQVYHEGTSLQEMAAAATGKPGEIAPPCPDIATVTRLKEAGIGFGPCDLMPEEGAPVRLADPADEPKPDDVVCPALAAKIGLRVELPCRPGARIVGSAIVRVDGSYCARVTYIAEAGSPSRIETLCEGDVPSVGGEPVEGPPDDARGTN